MSVGVPQFNGGVCTVPITGAWLRPDGSLPACVVKPPPRSVEAIVADQADPDGVALATTLLGNVAAPGSPQLATIFKNQPGVLAFPEYAFSSNDFAALHGLVAHFPFPLLMFAGFGAVKGAVLHGFVEQGCIATWPENLDADANYNAGWCWVHRPPHTRCLVFVKNRAEQVNEIALIPNFETLPWILRLVGADLEAFPLICADLITVGAASPRQRIRAALAQPGPNVLVAALLSDNSPHSGFWHNAINDLITIPDRQIAVVTANLLQPVPRAIGIEDEWRCLTGVFVNRGVMNRGPLRALPNVRFIQKAETSGLLLRHPMTGFAAGPIHWRGDQPNAVRSIWAPRRWEGDGTVREDEPAPYETLRFIQRNRANLLQGWTPAGSGLVDAGLEWCANELRQKPCVLRLWPSLMALSEPTNGMQHPDFMDSYETTLRPALSVLAAIRTVTGAAPSTHAGRGQLTWQRGDGPWELRVWKDPDKDSWEMKNVLEQFAKRGGSTMPLVVVAGAAIGDIQAQAFEHNLPAEAIRPSRRADITDPPPSDEATRSIDTSRRNRVFFRPMSPIQNILLPHADNDHGDDAQIRAAILQHLN